MRILEYGDKSKRKIILIHGFQSPVKLWDSYIEHFKNDYHIIIPIITGHDPEKNEDFISFAEEARQIEDFCLSSFGEDIYAIYGMSMGGVLTAVIGQNGRLKPQKLIFDGSPLYFPMKKAVANIQKGFYLNVTHKTKHKDTKTLNQARQLVPERIYDEFIGIVSAMSDKTIENCIMGITGFDIAHSGNYHGAELYYFHGTRSSEALARLSAKRMKKLYPRTVVRRFEGKGHCENAMFAPEIMITELEKIFAVRE